MSLVRQTLIMSVSAPPLVLAALPQDANVVLDPLESHPLRHMEKKMHTPSLHSMAC